MKLYTKLAMIGCIGLIESYLLARAAVDEPSMAAWYVLMSIFGVGGGFVAVVFAVIMWVDAHEDTR